MQKVRFERRAERSLEQKRVSAPNDNFFAEFFR